MIVAGFALLFLIQDPEQFSARASQLAQAGQAAEAEKLWREALRAAPDSFSVNFNFGFFYFTRNDHPAAEPLLSRAVRLRPKDFNARYVLGAVLVQLGRGDDALRQWRAAAALRPDHVKLLQLMAVEYGKGRYFGEAAATAEKALALQTGDENLYLIAIKAYQDLGDHTSALRVAQALHARFPASARANFELGFELHRNGQPADALPYLRQAMNSSAAHEEPFFFYGEILVKEGKLEEAIPPLRRAIALRRDYMAAWVTLARALSGLGRLAEAKAELRTAISIDPVHPQPHLALSQICFRLGEEDEAIREKELSLKLRRENPQALEAPQSRPFR